MVEISQDWRQLADGHAHTTIPRKLDKILERLASKSDYPGVKVSTEAATDFPLFDAKLPDEATYLLMHLIERGFLNSVVDHRVCIITPAGWARLDPPTTGGVPGTCFVAMSFDTSLEGAYTLGIYPAIEVDCGYKAVRIDLVHHNEKICDRILAEIRRSQFMVADFTMQRHNVYFEAGFALGLGRPVIWSCREDEVKADKLQFDTRQYNHIAWTTANDLRHKLTSRIRATILPVK